MDLATRMADNQGMDTVLQVFDNVSDEDLISDTGYGESKGVR